MEKEFIEKWEKNKHILEDSLRGKIENCTYSDLFRLIVKNILNYDYEEYDIKNIKTIDDGDYQGTIIFIAHKETYQPSVGDYIYTSVYYGSCSGCDTLQAIQFDYDYNYNEQRALNDTLLLCLHMIQNMKYM